MPVRDDILAPIPGANPSGVDLIDTGDPVILDIRESRKEDPPGASRRPDDPPPRVADWGRVMKLCNDTLATKSKDLEVAGYLVDVLFKREGLPGFRAGLGVVKGLVENFWDTLHPPLEESPDEPPYAARISRLGWLGDRVDRLGKRNNRSDTKRGYLHPHFQLIPLVAAGHGLLKYNEARDVGAEADMKSPKEKQARQEKIDAGKMPWEEFQRALDDTKKDFYKALRAELGLTQQSLDALRAAVQAKCPDYNPGPGDSDARFSAIQDELTELLELASTFLAKKLETDPDPVEIVLEPETAAGGGAAGGTAGDAAAPMAEPKSADEAAQRVAQLAEYMRKFAPTNPSAYLMLRGLRWGELRASGPELDPRLLVAPPTHVRSLLKGLYLDHKWSDLLEQGERVMARPDGRGWLDLQRHVVTACSQLGPEYERVGAAIRSELALLLRDIPSLVEATLMDDTPTANAETLNWLRDQGLLPGGSEAASLEGAPAPVAHTVPRQSFDALYQRAMEAVRAGQARHAVEMLMQEAGRERSPRGRFLRMTQVARVMVDADLKPMALPILDEMEDLIKAKSLESWEAGDVVALPLALLYQCLPENSGRRGDLYQLVCKLDPVIALGLG